MEILPALTKEMASYEKLSREEEKALIGRSQSGDAMALDKLVKNNLRFVASIARKYARGNETLFPDLLNEGVIGLMRAIEKFDLSRDVRLIAYAAWWIRQAIVKSESLRTTWCKKLGQQGKVLQRLTEDLRRENGDYPNAGDLYAECERLELFNDSLTVEKVDDWLAYYMTSRITSLDDPVGEEGDSLVGDSIADDDWEEVLRKLENGSELDIVLENMNELPALERELLKKRYCDDLDLDEITAELEISREQVRQKLKLAETRLRSLLKKTCLVDRF